MIRRVIIVSIIILLATCSFNFWNSNEVVSFNSDIRPILNAKCMNCHGGVRQLGDLSFLFEKTALLPGKSGNVAIVPFHPERSELIKRIKHHDADMRMPLDADQLSETEISLLELWIKEGAEWETHWAYVPPNTRIPIPDAPEDWTHNEIDNFTHYKMSSEGLQPSAIADKSTLIRRVSLDLIGLPPTDIEVKEYLNDNSPQAYEKAVDRLLSSPHFGEKWASMWLDLARYADSRGYQKDILRPEIWRYRDWVIQAFNDDMPFDQFTIKQLAGDLLPDKTDDDILATAFHRNTMTNDEGGTKDEEFRLAAVMDRVNTTMEIWQGTTMACVQCHSHPYDPFEHESYYTMLAFFNNTADSDSGRDGPKHHLLSPVQRTNKINLSKILKDNRTKRDTVSYEYQETLKKYLAISTGKVPVMQELHHDSSRITNVLIKGNWMVHGEEVHPDVPDVLPAIKADTPKNRLGLAQWLMQNDNPLTGRVFVNRIWEQVFGNGLVSTLEDFGTQSEEPTHPELLDWLANRVITTHQWSLKSLLKEMTMSKTYQLSSNVTDDQLAKDPYNKYLSRGSRYRLSAEQIRDQALTVSGLLNNNIYGRSVMPEQPDGVWNVIRHVAKWEKSTDGDQHRRGLYTFWRRVSPYPSMLSFDVPSREYCVSRRIRTNTPTQALTTLNDPVFVEAARSLAHRMSLVETETIEGKIVKGYELALMNTPNDEYLELLVELYETGIKHNLTRESSMIEVASAILNLDEFIMRT